MTAIRIVLLLSLAFVTSALANDEPRHRAFDDLPLGRLEMSVFRTTLESHVADIGNRLYANMANQSEWMRKYSQENGDFEPGEALPYHENFGIAKEEYQTFLNGQLSVPIRRVALTLSMESNNYTIAAPEGDEFGTFRIDMQTAILQTEFGLTAQCQMGIPDNFPRDTDVSGWPVATCIANDSTQSNEDENSLYFMIGKTGDSRLLISFQAEIVRNGKSIQKFSGRLYSVDPY